MGRRRLGWRRVAWDWVTVRGAGLGAGLGMGLFRGGNAETQICSYGAFRGSGGMGGGQGGQQIYIEPPSERVFFLTI